MRSLIDVLFHMGLKCTGLRKCLTTKFADVRTFTGLQKEGKSFCLKKSFRVKWIVQAIPYMYSHMRCYMALLAECLITHRTRVGFHIIMHIPMVSQRIVFTKRLRTHITFVAFFAGMRFHMIL